MFYFFIFSSLLIDWRCSDKQCTIKKGTMKVPLRYSEDSSKHNINLSIPVVLANANATKAPILFMGPGNGNGNVPDTFDFAAKYFPDNPMYFVGYRGVESDPSPQDSEFKSLIRMEPSSLDDRLLMKIVNRTQTDFLLSDFWLPQRVDDILTFISQENIEYLHIIAIGEDGTRIAHEISSTLNTDIKKRILRVVLIGPSVNVPHNDTTIRLLAVIRRRCKLDPNCPFKYVRWLPKDIPKHAYGIFNVQPEKINYSISSQLRAPSAIPNALEVLQTISDGSNMGYISVAMLNGPETMGLKWTDVALHVCATPFDNSLFYLSSFKKICDFLPNSIEYNTNPKKIEQPLLIISGEFDLPRPKTVIDYFKNYHLMPTIVDQIVLNLTSSRFELLRPDILRTVIAFLNDGNTTYVIDPPEPLVWKNSFSMTKMVKWALLSGVIVSVGVTIFVYWKSNQAETSADIKKAARDKWIREQQKKKQ